MEATSLCTNYAPPIAALFPTGPRIGPSYQAGFSFHRHRYLTPEPAPKRRTRRYKLLDHNLRDGPRVTFRVAPSEAQQLVATAKELDMSVSELIRDALYEAHGIGELDDAPESL